MASNQSPVLSIRKFANYERDIAPVFKNAAVAETANDYEKEFEPIDVGLCLQKLVTVSDLLAIAYAGSKGVKCNSQVVKLLADYQTFCTDSHLASCEFLNASMKALQYTSMGFKWANDHQPDKAIQALSMTTRVADTMTGIASELVTKSEQMCALASDALVAACQDNGVAAETKTEIAAMITKHEVQKAELESTTQSLKNHLETAKSDVSEASRKADSARTMETVLTIVRTFATGLTTAAKYSNGASVLATFIHSMNEPETPESKDETADADLAFAHNKGDLARVNLTSEHDENSEKELKAQIALLATEIKSMEKTHKESIDAVRHEMTKKAESAAEREAHSRADRFRLQELDRKRNAELRGAIRKLSDMRDNRDSIGHALASLDIAIKAIGQVKTVFENTKSYWIGIKRHCEDLVEIESFELDKISEKMLSDDITTSWYSWLTLCKINDAAVRVMKEVTVKVDNTMSDLPTTEEAQELLSALMARNLTPQRVNVPLLTKAQGLGIRGLQHLLS